MDGKYSIVANRGDVLVVSYIGSKPMEVTVGSGMMDIDMQANDQVLDEVVVTALGIRKDKKSLGYAVDDLKADELMRNKNTNAINSLSGKIAGVNMVLRSVRIMTTSRCSLWMVSSMTTRQVLWVTPHLTV